MVNCRMPPQFIIADGTNIRIVKGDDGATFTPHVDEECNLSWTNNKGLDNPPTVNIRGKDASDVIPIMSNQDIENILNE